MKGFEQAYGLDNISVDLFVVTCYAFQSIYETTTFIFILYINELEASNFSIEYDGEMECFVQYTREAMIDKMSILCAFVFLSCVGPSG
mmetsp:Transcript_4967/g.5773  ORF Transcript_4967/g.5773 Transcript_4967/m.5773 type:complete len:88 (+) Transcript_4967:927-1190(+)